ncbi:unnamed protein product [Effrenium voratum]|nr:unnamed protein product [Effrenium voratum]CAJ1446724.1 unnamed protein product [Effrenium voratum]
MLRLSRFARFQKCPYSILGVSETATTEEIKRAFQERAKITHPDVVKGKDKHFREMVEAYRILRDPRKRAEHDRKAGRERVQADTWPRGEGEGLSEAARAKLYNYPFPNRERKKEQAQPRGPEVRYEEAKGDRLPLYLLALGGTFFAFNYMMANDPTKLKDMDPHPRRLPASMKKEATSDRTNQLGTTLATPQSQQRPDAATDTDKMVWAYYNPFLTVWHRIPEGFEPPASMDLTAWHKRKTDPAEWSRLFAEGKLAEIIPRGGLKVRLLPAWDTHEPVLVKDPMTQKTVHVTEKLLRSRSQVQTCDVRF